MKKRNNLVKFPNDREIIKKLSDPNHEGNLALTPDSTPLEKVKYELCQSVLAYKQDKKVSTEKLAQKIRLSIAETKELLLGHIHKFTFDRLITYVTSLGINLQITETRKNFSNSTHKSSRTISLSSKSSNGRAIKHL
jgi:predicted XRE-type DNA-binding protein